MADDGRRGNVRRPTHRQTPGRALPDLGPNGDALLDALFVQEPGYTGSARDFLLIEGVKVIQFLVWLRDTNASVKLSDGRELRGDDLRELVLPYVGWRSDGGGVL